MIYRVLDYASKALVSLSSLAYLWVELVGPRVRRRRDAVSRAQEGPRSDSSPETTELHPCNSVNA